MDNFEKRLASLPLARPSAGLRQRIFGDMSNTSPEVSWFRSFFRRGVSVGRAACIAVAASLAAAMLVHSFNRPGDSMSVTPSEQNITIHLRGGRNLFDFTRTGADLIDSDFDAGVVVDEEV